MQEPTLHKATLLSGVQSLPPAYFALVMSTGIISIASHLLGYESISRALFVLNNIEFAVLLLLFTLRAVRYSAAVRNDLSAHDKGAGFLTITAGTCILATQYIVLLHARMLPMLLFLFALLAWLVLIFSFFILITIREQKPTLETGMNGTWLLFVVSTQSLSIVLSNLLSFPLPVSGNSVLFASLCFYLLSIMFYIVLISIIFYRTAFYPMKPDEFKPSYWIDMGAAAITVLSGATLIHNIGQTPLYAGFIPTIKLFCLLFWITSSWWIPVVLILEVWRHKAIGLRYNAGYWSLVFPLGMYTVATWQFSAVYPAPFLQSVSRGFIFAAWGAWLLTFIGLCIYLFQLIEKKR